MSYKKQLAYITRNDPAYLREKAKEVAEQADKEIEILKSLVAKIWLYTKTEYRIKPDINEEEDIALWRIVGTNFLRELKEDRKGEIKDE